MNAKYTFTPLVVRGHMVIKTVRLTVPCSGRAPAADARLRSTYYWTSIEGNRPAAAQRL